MRESDTEAIESRGALDAEVQRRAVRERYARIATRSDETGETDADSAGCCSTTESGDDCAERASSTDEAARMHGYSTADLASVAGEANLGLGCGNPGALASIEPGEVVVDLGSGAGFDCFLAAQEVGETGRVIGVDMTPEMIEKARENIRKNGSENVEFRLGEIEHLPVADESVDVIISNCVVNLSPAKARVFREAYRVLRPGGRVAISDVVLTAEVPDAVRADPDSVASCVAGASTIETVERLLAAAGFEDIDVSPKRDSDRFIREWDDERDLSEFLVSAEITGWKPK